MPSLGTPPHPAPLPPAPPPPIPPCCGYSNENTSTFEVPQSRGMDILRIIIMQNIFPSISWNKVEGRINSAWEVGNKTASERRLCSCSNFVLRRGVGISSAVGCWVFILLLSLGTPCMTTEMICLTSTLSWPWWPNLVQSKSTLAHKRLRILSLSLSLSAGFSLKMNC